MKLTVSGKEYTVEYTFEAAHNKKCVDLCWNYFTGAYAMSGVVESGMSEDEVKVNTVSRLIGSMSDIPQMVITLLYAGLIENHEEEISSGKDARNLYKQFCKENPEDDLTSDFEMFNAIKNQMEEDGFFKRIGLEKFMEQMNQTVEEEIAEPKTPKRATKISQDHKKKSPSGKE